MGEMTGREARLAVVQGRYRHNFTSSRCRCLLFERSDGIERIFGRPEDRHRLVPNERYEKQPQWDPIE